MPTIPELITAAEARQARALAAALSAPEELAPALALAEAQGALAALRAAEIACPRQGVQERPYGASRA